MFHLRKFVFNLYQTNQVTILTYHTVCITLIWLKCMPGDVFKNSYIIFNRSMAEAFPSMSSGTRVESYYIKEPKVNIPPHKKVVLPIRGPIIHDASEFMAAHLELNNVEVSHKYKYFTGTLVTGALGNRMTGALYSELYKICSQPTSKERL